MEINIDAFARFSYHITSLAQSDPPQVLDQSFSAEVGQSLQE